MAEINQGRIIDSLYKDSEGNIVSLNDLRAKIENECFDLAQYRGDSLSWLKQRGSGITEYQRMQSEVTNQRLMFYCMEPLTDGLSFNSILHAAGMYIGMSLVNPGIKKEWASMKASGASMVSTTVKNNKLLKHLPGSKALTGMLDKFGEKQTRFVNDGRLPYTVMSASTEYLRIENAAYQAMRVPDDQLKPPTVDQMTLCSHIWKTKERAAKDAFDELTSLLSIYGTEKETPEIRQAREAYENARSDADKAQADMKLLLKASDSWDSLTPEDKRHVHCMCVRADAEECKDLLYQQADLDGVGRMNIADCVNQMIGNARIRSEQARKDLRAKQRAATQGDPGAELRAAWRYGQDNVHEWRKFSEMGFDLDEAEFSTPDSVLVTEIGDDGKPHYKQVNVWDGTFIQNGKALGEAMHAREPMTPQTLMRAMEKVTSKYREESSPKDIARLESASEFVRCMVDGDDQRSAYDKTLALTSNWDKLSAEDAHKTVKALRNYIADMSELVSQARADGVSDSEISGAIGFSSTMQAIDDAVIEYQSESPIFTDKKCDTRNYMLQLLSNSVGTVMSVAERDIDGLPSIEYSDRGIATGDCEAPAEFVTLIDDQAVAFADAMIGKGYIDDEHRNQAIVDFSQMAYMYGSGLNSNLNELIDLGYGDSEFEANAIVMANEAACTSIASNCAIQMNIKDQDNWETLRQYAQKKVEQVRNAVGTTFEKSTPEKTRDGHGSNREVVAAAYRGAKCRGGSLYKRHDNGHAADEARTASLAQDGPEVGL